MNRYWLFQMQDYEAYGGLCDLQYTFRSAKKAMEYVDSKNSIKYDESYIVDSKTWTIIWQKEYDMSWEKLLALLKSSRSAMTAAELADRWGRSRSRTSEVLNKLVEEGQLVKFRDGRRIRFRTTEE